MVRMLGTGCWVLGTGCWVLGTGEGAKCRAELYSAGKRPARVCGQASREGRPGRVWEGKVEVRVVCVLDCGNE